jgi:hypothetical protein
MPFIRTAPVARPMHPIIRAYLKQRGLRGYRRGMGQDDSTTTDDESILSLPVAGGVLPLELLNPTTGTPISTTATTPSTLTSVLSSLPGLLQSGVQTYNVLQGPSLVAGTNAIYNPATGQYYNPTTGQVVNPSGITLSAYMPIILIGGGLLVAATAMLLGGKH